MSFANLPSAPARPTQKWDMTPAKVERDDRRKVRKSLDEKGSEKVKDRSGGRCEIVVHVNRKVSWRCKKRGLHIHHMLGGWGVRARGKSALAAHKQHVCADCHPLLTGHVLQRIGGVVPLWTDTYRKVKSKTRAAHDP